MNMKKIELMYLYKVFQTSGFKKYNIEKKFYNKDNLCYGVIINYHSANHSAGMNNSTKSGKSFYLCINNSKDKTENVSNYSKEILSLNHIKNTDVWELHSFIKDINNHITEINNKYSHVEKNTLSYSKLMVKH